VLTDPHGAVVPQTTIEAINNATNAKSTVSTNGDGLYYLAALPPGSHRIVVSKDGFKQIIQGDVLLHTQDELTLNFALQIGSVAETVTAGGINVNTTDGAVSTVVDRQFVANMPLNGRSFQDLLTLAPGVALVGNVSSRSALFRSSLCKPFAQSKCPGRNLLHLLTIPSVCGSIRAKESFFIWQ